jgi:predicted DNA repair protein MutK
MNNNERISVMPGSSLLTLLDDIATLLDDVSVMTKVAAKQTAGVLGDDLALNAHQVSGVNPDRELPVVWAVCKGSFVNKLILVPSALLISAFIPWLIVPLLLLGGAYLCYEGSEKIVHKFIHKASEHESHYQELVEAVSNPGLDLVQYEKDKIKGAIRTDFILSAEIIVITLGAVAQSSLGVQIGALCAVAVLMTIGVYGFVAGIVKLDDAGLHLIRHTAQSSWAGIKHGIGRFLLWLAPKLMKFLSIAGTAAMFLVGGGILTHNVPVLHHWVESAAQTLPSVPWLLSGSINAVFGLLLGLLVVALVAAYGKLFAKQRH